MTQASSSHEIAPPLEFEPAKAPLRIAALVFVVAFAVYFPIPLDAPLAGAEAQRAVTAHQMVESGEWVVPRLFGRIYLTKPPLHYWILASFEKVVGTTQPWIWRLPAAIEAAFLAAVLSLFGSRWFGRIGGIVSGFAYVALFTIWAEDRSGDIDVSNTVSATIASLILIELHHNQPRRRWAWVLGAAVAVTACMMIKAHAGLSIVMGTLIWAGIVEFRRGRRAWVFRLSVWLPFLVGIAVFGVYAYAAWSWLTARQLPLDFTGLQEGVGDLTPKAGKIVQWLTLPPTMFAYAVPISLAIPIGLMRSVRGEHPRTSRLMVALAGSVLIAWAICLATGMRTPRYAYVTLPLMCPLAGAIAARFSALDFGIQRGIRITVAVCMFMFGVVAIFLAVKVWKDSSYRAILAIASGAAILLASLIAGTLLKKPDWRAARGIPVVLLLLSVPFTYFWSRDRRSRTCLPAAQTVRSIVGPDAKLIGCDVPLWQPELPYYTGLPTRGVDGDEVEPRHVTPGSWVLLSEIEYKHWSEQVPRQMHRITPLPANKNKVYLIWYATEPPATRPASRP